MSDSVIQNNGDLGSLVSIGTNLGKINIGAKTRWARRFEHLRNEILGNTRQEIIEELLTYKTKIDGTKGLEEKLQDGGFSPSYISFALHQKEMYAKKAMRYECYPSAQVINRDLFASIKSKFDVYVQPLIVSNASISIVMETVSEKIVDPIMTILDSNGEADEYLNYSIDHIYGMIYYLTGMCHLNWKDYDNI